MSLILPVVWIKYAIMFPAQARQEGTRLNEMAKALMRAVPDPVDAVGILLSYSVKHVTLSQKVGTTGHPLHLFIYSDENWKAMLGFLNAIAAGEKDAPPRIFCSASVWAEQAPKKAEDVKVVQIPPGTSKEEAEKMLAAAKAEQAAAATATPPAPAQVSSAS